MAKQLEWDWKRKLGAVTWADVWAWCGELRDHWGLWCVVSVVPPLPTLEQKMWGTVVVRAERHYEGGKVEAHVMQRVLPYGGKESAEQCALFLVSALHQRLDSEELAAERAAGQGTLPL